MKKLLFIFTLAIATTVIYGVGKSVTANDPKDTKPNGKSKVHEIKGDHGSDKPAQTTRSTQKVTFLLYKGTPRADWSPSIWWNPQGSNPGKDGC